MAMPGIVIIPPACLAESAAAALELGAVLLGAVLSGAAARTFAVLAGFFAVADVRCFVLDVFDAAGFVGCLAGFLARAVSGMLGMPGIDCPVCCARANAGKKEIVRNAATDHAIRAVRRGLMRDMSS